MNWMTVKSDVVSSFEVHEIVPDIVPKAPNAVASVLYPSGVVVNLGNVLMPSSVQETPIVEWDADSNQFYTLAMIDADPPSRAEPTAREYQHWLVGNVPGANIEEGERLSDYIGSGPPAGTGLHRYVFLVYQQPGKLTFDEPRLTNVLSSERGGFSIADFAIKYSMGDPIAGNFYQSEYED
ncbi:unnamed protein product [Arctia plantaginis]|uniref:Phosphatidylethanolamine-binding protein n=1 Tax=Arctia plantaginis TaxID=874455 RepID=A0A8S0YL38_ARCPL|nr:unnamed protein product [Arctia plantaginis]